MEHRDSSDLGPCTFPHHVTGILCIIPTFLVNLIRQWYIHCLASLLEAGRVALGDRNWDEQAVSGRLHVHLGRMDSGWGLLLPRVSETPGSPRAFVWCLLDLSITVRFSAEPLDPAALSSIIMVITPPPSNHRSGGGKWSTIICPGLWTPHMLLQRDGYLSLLNERKAGRVAVA